MKCEDWAYVSFRPPITNRLEQAKLVSWLLTLMNPLELMSSLDVGFLKKILLYWFLPRTKNKHIPLIDKALTCSLCYNKLISQFNVLSLLILLFFFSSLSLISNFLSIFPSLFLTAKHASYIQGPKH